MRLPGVVASRVSVTLVCILLTACGQSEAQKLKAENDDLQAQVDHLNEKLESVRSSASDLRETVDAAKATSADLEAEAGRFDDDNWRDVVPNLQEGSSQVSADISDVDSRLDDLESAAAED